MTKDEGAAGSEAGRGEGRRPLWKISIECVHCSQPFHEADTLRGNFFESQRGKIMRVADVNLEALANTNIYSYSITRGDDGDPRTPRSCSLANRIPLPSFDCSRLHRTLCSGGGWFLYDSLHTSFERSPYSLRFTFSLSFHLCHTCISNLPKTVRNEKSE